ncbi:btbd11b [Symbiodinium sp. CCMP2592]|nr:btbd11b [Symbiodinium sp. CCMP2592]
MRQFRVLQDALRNVLSGEARVMVDMPTELSIGLSKAAESTCALASADRIFFWYDYFSCPQLEGQENPGVPMEKSALRDAVNSIPAYIKQSDIFLALCPVLTSREKQSLLSHSTWSNRGWCRVELAVRELSSKVPDCILVKSPVHLEMKVETSVKSAGEGVFTVESDRLAIAPVLNNFFKSKLASLLKDGDFPKYRLLLNQQRARLRGLHVQSVEDLVPSFDGTGSPGCNYTNRFLHQNGFQHLNECDAAGWTPICYAAVKGDPTIVQALLDARANPNDTTRKPRMDADIGKRTPVLCISIKFQNLKVAELLIQRRAAINVENIFLPPLHFAAFTNNPEAVKTLCRHRADLGIKRLGRSLC